MHHNLLVHPLVDGQQSCFQFFMLKMNLLFKYAFISLKKIFYGRIGLMIICICI